MYASDSSAGQSSMLSFFFFSSRRRHTRSLCDWSSDVCSSDLTSGTTVTWAHHALLENDRQGLKWGLILTIVLGLAFTCVQAYEYSHAGFNFSGNIYGATFFMATGFHGAHVIIGSTFLILCLLRAYLGRFTPSQHLGFEFAAWYWHFVDVVWIFLFS